VVLSCHIAEGLGPAVQSQLAQCLRNLHYTAAAHYFSTQGCTLVVSFVCFSALLDAAPFAAAAFRALRSKKPDMIGRRSQSLEIRCKVVRNVDCPYLDLMVSRVLDVWWRFGADWFQRGIKRDLVAWKALYASKFIGNAPTRIQRVRQRAPCQPLTLGRGSPNPESNPGAPLEPVLGMNDLGLHHCFLFHPSCLLEHGQLSRYQVFEGVLSSSGWLCRKEPKWKP